MDNLDFLDGGEPPIAETQPQETPVEQAVEQHEAEQPSETTAEAEQSQGRERDERGRFKGRSEQEPVMVPLQALHETRDKVKDLETRLAALQAPQQAAETPQVPDIFENPEGYQAYIENQITERLTNTTLNLSEASARRAVGDELVSEAQEWGKQILSANPSFAQAFFGNPDPYGFLVEQFKQQSLLARIAIDPKQLEAFLSWQQQGQAPQPAQATSTTTSTPTSSIASATSAGGVSHSAMGPGVAFGEIFK